MRCRWLSRTAGQCADQRSISFDVNPSDASADKNRLSLGEGEATVVRDEGAPAVEAEYRPRADVLPLAGFSGGDLLDGQVELLHARSEELVAVAIQLGLDDSGF